MGGGERELRNGETRMDTRKANKLEHWLYMQLYIYINTKKVCGGGG